MEPITAGVKMSLVFNVLWKKEVIGPPKDIPSFILSYRTIKEALTNWIPQETIANNDCEKHPGQRGNQSVFKKSQGPLHYEFYTKFR